jgi:hypothetical protein
MLGCSSTQIVDTMDADIKKLNRFITIPYLIDLLKRQKLTLLNPRFWEDFNDRETMEVYRNSISAGSIYALCMSHDSETVHHWNAFANGTSGCCIEFSPQRLAKFLDRTDGVSHGKVDYLSIRNLKGINPATLPFIKRQPFEPEREYRIVATCTGEQKSTLEIDIDINTIRRITINNRIPATVYESVKETLLQINPDFKPKIYHSTLYNNPVWINHFRNKYT